MDMGTIPNATSASRGSGALIGYDYQSSFNEEFGVHGASKGHKSQPAARPGLDLDDIKDLPLVYVENMITSKPSSSQRNAYGSY